MAEAQALMSEEDEEAILKEEIEERDRIHSLSQFFLRFWELVTHKKRRAPSNTHLYVYTPTYEVLREPYNGPGQEVTFYNDDGTSQTVLVEKDLCASDLCQLLALKNSVAKSLNWGLVEHWIETGLERILEDHEKVLEVYHFMDNAKHSKKSRFIFRNNIRKYEFYEKPEQYLPMDMIDYPRVEGMTDTNCYMFLRSMLAGDQCILRVISNVWVLDKKNNKWEKGYIIFRDGLIYLTMEIHLVTKLLDHWKNIDDKDKVEEIIPQKIAEVWGSVHTIGMISEFNIYSTINARNYQRAPSDFGIILRSPNKRLDAESGGALFSMSCDSDTARTCWIVAMRLAKYGKQIRDNYKAYLTKSVETNQYSSHSIPRESVRSRVAMDFTGPTGVIIDDPVEAEKVKSGEVSQSRMQRQPNSPAQLNARVNPGLSAGLHVTQPWFHSGMVRQQATELISRHGSSTNGVFVVRESRSNPGSYVLSYSFNSRVVHQMIHPVAVEDVRSENCFTLDNNNTRFYDLLQLVEFYQLNCGSLPTRLTHHIVKTASGGHRHQAADHSRRDQ